MIQRSAHPLKGELVLCLAELNEEDENEDESEAWMNMIDRGGLKHVDNLTYTLFATMELVLRQHLNSRNVNDLS